MTRLSLRLGLLSSILLTGVAIAASACGGGSDDRAQASANVEAADGRLSYVGNEIVRRLTTKKCSNGCAGDLFLPQQGKTWEVTFGNELGGVPLAGKGVGDWLLPTFGSEWWDKVSTLP